MRYRPQRWIGLAAAAWVAAGGCAPAPVPFERLIASMPDDTLLEPAVWLDRQPVDLGGLGAWHRQPPTDVSSLGRRRDGPLLVDTGATRNDLWHGPIQAADVDAFVLTLGSARAVDAHLCWTRVDHEAVEHCLDANAVDGLLSRRSYRFEVSGYIAWRGSIRSLRLTARQAMASPIRFLAIETFHDSTSAARWAAASERPWMAEADDERRVSLIVAPDRAVRRNVRVPPLGRLRFAVGSAGRLARPMRFRLRVESAGQTSTVFETTIEATGSASDRRWLEVDVDLAAYARRTVDLVAEADVKGTFDPRMGFLVLANPMLVGGDDPRPGRPSLVLISIDTLRADRLGIYGERPGLSPAIDAWARTHATVFRHAVAPAPWTLPSHTSMLSGLDALRHGVNEPFARAPGSIETVAERLRNAGYATAAVTGGGWLHPRYGLAQGFDRYRYERSEVDLATSVDHALALVDELPRPFFLFVHTYAVHDYMNGHDPADFATPSEARNTSYDDAVIAMDREIGRLLARLSAPDLAGRVGVALTSDHGEELGEEGDFGHGSLRDTVLRVPMLWAFPGNAGAGTEVDRTVRTIDVATTLLDLAGLAADRDTHDRDFVGRSLTPIRSRIDDPPRLAVSFFSLPGHGLSLQQGRRWQYLLDDGLIGARMPRERMVDRFARTGSPVDEDALAALDRLRTKARRALRSRLVRAWLELRNEGPSHLDGRLSGPAVRFARLADPDPMGVRLRSLADHAVRVRLAPNSAIRLALVPPAEGSMHWSLEGTDEPSGIELALTQGIDMRWSGTAWEPVTSAAGGTMTIRLTPGDAADDADVSMDPELEARLRALGYLDGG